MSEGTCKDCNGTGKIGTNYDDGSYMTDLCRCRRDLPLRHGKAFWWTTGPSVCWEYQSECNCLEVAVTVSPELPIDEHGYPLYRTRGNQYFSTGATVEITKGDSVLTSRDLRTLAAFLVECADKINVMDTPVAEPEEAKA